MADLRRGERGAALLVVVVALAVLTALAAEVAYASQVRLQLAADARDELRASWLARSGVATARLVLAFQQQIDASMGRSSTTTPLPGPGAGGPATAGAAAQGAAAAATGGGLGALMGGLSIRVWSLVPINSAFTSALLGAPASTQAPTPPRGDGGKGPALARFGDFEGAFDAVVEDEASKANAQLDSLAAGGQLGPQVLALYQLTCDPRWDPLFDREDAQGQRNSRTDVIVHLRDWVDDDATSSTLKASFPGGPCQAIVADSAFENGFGDENYPYDRGPSDERYRAKNARFDSIDELYLVSGISDAFMAAFGDRLTVYLGKDSPRTLDPTNPDSLVEAAKGVADPPGQAVLYDPEFKAKLQRLVMEQTLGGLLGLSAQTFARALVDLGVQVSAKVTTPGSTKNPLADRSFVYRVKASGSAGKVSRTLDVVVSFDPNQNRGVATPPPGKDMGRVLRWREE